MTGAEKHIVSNGKGPGIYSLRCFRCFLVGMEPHIAEIDAEARLKKGSFCRRQWLPATLQRGNC